MLDYVPQVWVDDDGSGTTGTPVTKARMDYIEGGIRDASIHTPWEPVQGTLSANINLAVAPGPIILDGEFAPGAITGRILLLGQTDPSQNGIYDYDYNGFSGASSMTRAADANLPDDFWQGRDVLVLRGTYANQRFTYIGISGATPDTDALEFVATSGGAAGRGYGFKVYRNAAFNISDGTQLQFDAVESDPDGLYHGVGQYQFVAPVDGLYHFSCCYAVNGAPGALDTYFAVRFFKNGPTGQLYEGDRVPNRGYGIDVPGEVYVRLLAGETFEARVTVGAAIAATGLITGPGRTWFAGHLVSAPATADNLVREGAYGMAVLNANTVASAGGGWKRIPFNVRTVDPYGAFDTATSRFRPTVPGWYRIHAVAAHNINSTSPLYLAIAKNANGSNPTTGDNADVDIRINNGTSIGALAGERTVYLNGTTDYVEAYMYWGTTNWTWQSDPADGDLLTFIEWELIGVSVGVIPEPWHVVGGPGEPAYSQGAAYNGGFRFRKDPYGTAFLEGEWVAAGAAGDTIFTLPAGDRPSRRVFSANNVGGPTTVGLVVLPTGAVVIDHGAPTGGQVYQWPPLVWRAEA